MNVKDKYPKWNTITIELFEITEITEMTINVYKNGHDVNCQII